MSTFAFTSNGDFDQYNNTSVDVDSFADRSADVSNRFNAQVADTFVFDNQSNGSSLQVQDTSSGLYASQHEEGYLFDFADHTGRCDFLGGDYADVIVTGSGADQLFGGGGNDVLSAGDGDDTLIGGVGANRLVGGQGDDVLVSSGGGDILVGGQGADMFVFAALTALKAATIAAFDAGDQIDLTQLAAGAGLAGLIAVYRFDGTAGEVIAAHNGVHNNTTLKFDLDGDGRADHKIVVAGVDLTDFSQVSGVDTSSYLTHPGHGHDHGGLTV